MDRLIAPNTVPFGSQDAVPSGTPGMAVDANPTIGRPGTIWPAYGWNMIEEELRNAILAAGLTPNGSDWSQLSQTIQSLGRRRQIFTSSATFTVPVGVSFVKAMVWGAGGGSGGTYQAGSASLGGGGGGYTERRFAVTPGATISITVGGPGVAGAGGASPTAGGSGGTSSVGTYCSATGGQGGAAATGSPAGGSTFGGNGVGGDFNVAGSTCDGPFGLTVGVYTSAGGTSWGGLRAHSGSSNISAPGQSGPFPGGGAAGGANESNGGTGGGGLVVLEY